MESNDLQELDGGELCVMKDALVHLESSIRTDTEGPAVLTSPSDGDLSGVVVGSTSSSSVAAGLRHHPLFHHHGNGSSRTSSLAATGQPRFPSFPVRRRSSSTGGAPSAAAEVVRPPTPPLRGDRGAPFRTFVPRGEIRTEGNELNVCSESGADSEEKRQYHQPRESAASASSSFEDRLELGLEESFPPPPPLISSSSSSSDRHHPPLGVPSGSQRSDTPVSFANGLQHPASDPDSIPDGEAGQSDGRSRLEQRNPLAFLLQVAKERRKYLEESGERESSSNAPFVFHKHQPASFQELHLEHRELSKKYKEDLKKSSSSGSKEEMVRKQEHRHAHAYDRHARYQPRIPLGENDIQDNLTSSYFNSPMSTSGTQTQEQLNGNVEIPDMDPTLGETGNCNLSSIYHGDWPIDRVLWNSAPSTFGENDSLSGLISQDALSIMSFSSNTSSNSFNARKMNNAQPFGTKVEMVYSLLSMLGAHDREDMSKTLLAMSQSQESCIAMRQSGCLPLLVQLLHSNDEMTSSSDDLQINRRRARGARRRASAAMHNIVHAYVDDKQGRRETRVLRLLEQIRDYCDHLRDVEGLEEEEDEDACPSLGDQHLGPAIAALMKLSFDEDHRNAMCQLGGLHAIAELIEVDQAVHGNTSDQFSVTLRRYAGMALTNLTFGDGTNKALLCSMKPFMYALVAQLHSPSEDLRQVTASVLRNLSWRADSTSKQILREVGAVTTLMKAAMEATKESTLKSILSALWNLSAHCSANKVDICAVDGALAFLVGTLNHKNPAIVENGGGILRNISSHIAIHEDHRSVLRAHNCLEILLQHLKSSSLTVVSNACGTLWNLSARCPEDQKALWDMGAVDMLRNLVHSKHKMISMGSSAALKNLISAKPIGRNGVPAATSLNQRALLTMNGNMPSLLVRKQRALEEEIDQSLAETCENIDSPKSSPTHRSLSLDNRFVANGNYPPYMYLPGRMYHSVNGQVANGHHVPRSESRESVGSTHSEPVGMHNIRSVYHNFTRNRRFASLDHRYYHRNVDIDRNGYPGIHDYGIRVEDYHPVEYRRHSGNRMSGSYHAEERQPRSPDKKKRHSADYSHSYYHQRREIDFNQNLPSTSTNGLGHPPPSTTSSVWQLREGYKDLTKKLEEMNLDSHAQDQPIDYSRKYAVDSEFEVEDNKKDPKRFIKSKSTQLAPTQKVNNYVTDKNEQNERKKSEKEIKAETFDMWQSQKSEMTDSSSSVFTHKQTLAALRKSGQECSVEHLIYSSYQETDLDDPDQPTDYSSKYKERMDLTEEYESKFMGDESTVKLASCHDDSLKVYCTEGTPLNFSTASSMSDLREIPTSSLLDTPQEEEEDATIIEENEPSKKSVSETKTSRVIKPKEVKGKEISAKQTDTVKKPSVGLEKEVKSVTFGQDVDYATETPLMFSRCSSMGSLNSFDQHSIHDDRSSVVSDFSRRASEVVSPSDLPDSPSQTMPASPRRHKQGSAFNFSNKSESSNSSPARVFGTHSSPLKLVSRVHLEEEEDSKKIFAEEGTPVEFSRGTSLSSLTINDAEKVSLKCKENRDDETEKERETSRESVKESNAGTRGSSPVRDNANEEVSDTDTNDEDLLNACIISGMPNSRNEKGGNNNNTPRNVKGILPTGIPVPLHNGLPVPLKPVRSIGGRPKSVPNMDTANKNLTEDGFNSDSTKVYKTEGTPGLSHATSLSELSVISGMENQTASPFNHSEYRSDSSASSACDDNENLLQQCIQSGMPKSKIPILPRTNNLSQSLDAGKQDNLSNNKFRSLVPIRMTASEYRVEGDGTSSSDEQQPLTPQHHHLHHPQQQQQQQQQINQNQKRHQQGSHHNCGFNHTWAKPDPDRSISNLKKVKRCSSAERKTHLVTAAIRPMPPQQDQLKRGHSYTPDSCDSPRMYLVEGTPVAFSRNDSLSSLSCEEENRDKNEPDKTLSQSTEGDKKFQSNIPTLFKHPERATVSSTHSDSSQGTKMFSSTPNQSPSKFAVSDATQQEPKQSFMVEGTPVCFSRNSSLSSLSVESLDEPSTSEQALLEECINSGKPKDSPKDKRRRARAPGGIPVLCKPFEKPGARASPKSSPRTANRLSNQYQNAMEECEEKIKEDERTKENISKGEGANRPDVTGTKSHQTEEKTRESEEAEDEVLVVTIRSTGNGSNKNSPPDLILSTGGRVMTESFEIHREAKKIVEKVEAEAEDLTQSSLSCVSDLDNVKPPSVMGDLLSLSMNSSGFSEVEKGATWRKGKDGRRMVPETVRRALGGNIEAMKSSMSSDIIDNVKPPSCMGSIENLSMKSSFTSDLLDNINPPSAMDLLTRTGSCTSLNSISSDILECQSPSMGDFPNGKSNGGGNTEMFQRLNAAAAMVQVYSRELSNIMNGGNKSTGSSNSEMIEHINPPSMYIDIGDLTVHDGTEVMTDTMASDTEMEEDLPRDDETDLGSSDTLRGPRLFSLARDDDFDGSTENVSTLIEDSPRKRIGEAPRLETTVEESGSPLSDEVSLKRKIQAETNERELGGEGKRESPECREKMDLTAEEFQKLQDDANRLASNLHQLGNVLPLSDEEDIVSLTGGNSEKMLDDETISLVSNESDHEMEESDDEINNATYQVSPRQARIVKPVIRERISSLPKPSHPIKGKEPSLLYNRISSSSAPPLKAKETPPVPNPAFKETVGLTSGSVKPTRASAVRSAAIHSNRSVRPPIPIRKTSPKRASEETALTFSRPPPPPPTRKSAPEVPPKPKFDTNTFTRPKDKATDQRKSELASSNLPAVETDADENRPKLVKQGTFTKDSPTHNAASTSGSSAAERKRSSDPSPGASSLPDCRETSPGRTVVANQHNRRMSYGGSTASGLQNVNAVMRRNNSGLNLRKDPSAVVNGGMKNSASSRSLTRQDDGIAIRPVNKTKRSPSSSSLGSRESPVGGSNVSLSSTSSSGTRKSNFVGTASGKKEVTSKIASIWKKGAKPDLPARSDGASRSRIATAASSAGSGKAKIVKPVTISRNSRL